MEAEKGKVGHVPCSALVPMVPQNPDVIIFSPAQPFRVEPTPYRASHIPFGQKDRGLPGRSMDIWSSTHRVSIPFSLQHHLEVEESPHPVPQVGSIHDKPRLGPTPRRDVAQSCTLRAALLSPKDHFK